jgi:hypothetical protein
MFFSEEKNQKTFKSWAVDRFQPMAGDLGAAEQ